MAAVRDLLPYLVASVNALPIQKQPTVHKLRVGETLMIHSFGRSQNGRQHRIGLPFLALLVVFGMVGLAHAQFTLVKISADSFHNSDSQHKTEVEPDTYSWSSTMVAAFQVARISSGGGADLGFATTTDAGKTWVQGYLPGLTTNYKNGTFQAASDASIVYCAKYGVWLFSSLPISNSGVDVAVSRSTDGINWDKPIMVDSSGGDDKNWITCDNNSKSSHYGNCYTEWDSGTIFMSTSTDGGKTWGPAKTSSDGAQGLGGEPLVLPNGTVVVPFLGNGIQTFSSTNGGTSGTKSGDRPGQHISGQQRPAQLWAAPALHRHRRRGQGIRSMVRLQLPQELQHQRPGDEHLHQWPEMDQSRPNSNRRAQQHRGPLHPRPGRGPIHFRQLGPSHLNLLLLSKVQL
jgi:hypothetical protein